jgi:hypothetical protein
MYGDGIVGELERRTARTLGMEAAAFFPTGTMAQQVALRCWAGRTRKRTVALHPRSTEEICSTSIRRCSALCWGWRGSCPGCLST